MSAIDDKYAQLGGADGFLGDPTSAEMQASPTSTWRFRHYQRGSIYWSAATDAHEIHGAIQAKWVELELQGPIELGYPLTDMTPTIDGQAYYVTFAYGTIIWNPTTGAFDVHMTGIDQKYTELGGAGGFLGEQTYPEIQADSMFRVRHFQGGSIYWSVATGAHEIHGAIRDKWVELELQGPVGLGFPLTDETSTPDEQGRFNHFAYGSIYWHPTTGAFEVHGAIRAFWAEIGWEQSYLGYPLSDELATPGPLRCQRFQGGSLLWTPERWRMGGARRWDSLSLWYR